jgi:hypothetical protein
MSDHRIGQLESGRTPGLDRDARDALTARRNVLLDLWAARRLGLAGQAAEAYAWSVHFADFAAPGHDDIVAKIAADFAEQGLVAADRLIRRQLHEMALQAEGQLAAEPTGRRADAQPSGLPRYRGGSVRRIETPPTGDA